ncbi:MAG: hypothetical protein JXB38_13975 [Anaerolineales bacterium]|nr:hypothetical protein [Anaerolineales bacterium]
MTQTHPEDTPAEKLGRVLMASTQEILGRSEFERVVQTTGQNPHIKEYQGNNLKLKFSSVALSGILNAIEVEYGARPGRGLILRIGGAGFKYGLREFGPELGLTDLAFRLLPLKRRSAFLVKALAEPANQVYPGRVQVVEADGRFLWQVSRCDAAEAAGLDSGQLESLLVGFLREAMYWVSGGKPAVVESIPVGTETATFLCKIDVYQKTY